MITQTVNFVDFSHARMSSSELVTPLAYPKSSFANCSYAMATGLHCLYS